MGLFDAVSNLGNAIARPLGGRQTVAGRLASDWGTMGYAEVADPEHGLFPGAPQGQQYAGPGGAPVNLPPPGGGPAYGGSTTMQSPNYTDAEGKPVNPAYQSIRGADGNLLAPYQVTPGKLNNSSAWQDMAQKLNTNQTNQAVSNAQTMGKTGTDTAWGRLAQSGGLSSGAAERTAAMGDKAALMAGQDARAQGASNALNIGMQGQQMDTAANQFNIANDFNAQQANAGKASQDVSNFNQANNFNYGQNMADWTGRYSANATANAYNSQPQSVWSRLTGGLF